MNNNFDCQKIKDKCNKINELAKGDKEGDKSSNICRLFYIHYGVKYNKMLGNGKINNPTPKQHILS